MTLLLGTSSRRRHCTCKSLEPLRRGSCSAQTRGRRGLEQRVKTASSELAMRVKWTAIAQLVAHSCLRRRELLVTFSRLRVGRTGFCRRIGE